ncbi:fructose-1,6-bisphosphatase [[Clostridium] symbiosum]|uniref:Fructose-1,6-bisphosphatase class 3 n=1 Tax=Clostridium symbiosum TaxID=1512 RepID=A0AAW6AZ79_CLOSY|nr:fructose-1,6-bisphosphatase [[Clostridium] symbiosum]MDB1979589.1 fructose-1,6-bisphosphatase [[Clostridium] symbiosum]MDB1982864.1 fructose-1,6-bisphosphatase [[Clostridium] symbiosum]MDB1987146.1 fructose-1,6-bisphosphatase [[Clostridium] symbiosum]MDB1991888.1 fructose-1,6-bisphosphatase [[Clostridium] symbiosum]MDB1997691.1 fructose-1,6-bisphosphatase [[Clostridium] symbiosum]
MRDLAYLKLMSREYPTLESASSEIVNLMAICGLPKGTEYFFSDLHGEYEAFIHLLRSSSGIIREKIKETFGHIISEEDEIQLANLIYYPDRQIAKLKQEQNYTEDWQRIALYRLVQICKEVSSKYSRSKVRKKMPPEFAYAIDELLHVDYNDDNKKVYYSEIIRSIIDTQMADSFIIALCRLIQNLTIDNLHIIGDIFDRGPRADIIMEELMQFHDVDIQWGNHDISWMGASTGNPACICNVLRIAISYNGFDVLEDGYGINIRPLSMFAAKVYSDDPCERFMPRILDQNIYDAVDPGLAAKMHKAIAVIQFKVEGQIIRRHPEYEMDSRILLTAIDYQRGTVVIEGKEYPMMDMEFPTIDPSDPLKLSEEEEELLHTLTLSFCHSALLHKHIKFLYSNGSMYKCCNSNLLYHGCIPMKEDGSFDEMAVNGKAYKGRALMDFIDKQVKKAYFLPDQDPEKEASRDFMWYLWSGAKSPVFGKDKMTIFEHYFVEDKEASRERMNPYYKLSVQEKYCDMILEEFGLTTTGSHIINGHVPVKIKDGETPIKAGGKLFIIDGGLSKAYQGKTGIAGYTLIFNSRHLALAEHKPFDPKKESTPKVSIVEKMRKRIMVADTDDGKELARRIEDLKELVAAHRKGALKERIR